jgi:hypothetical protein
LQTNGYSLCDFRRCLFHVADGESGRGPVSTLPAKLTFKILYRVQSLGKTLLFPKYICARNFHRNTFFTFKVISKNFRNLHLWPLCVNVYQMLTHSGGILRPGNFDKFWASLQQKQRHRTRYQLISLISVHTHLTHSSEHIISWSTLHWKFIVSCNYWKCCPICLYSKKFPPLTCCHLFSSAFISFF